MRETAPNTDPLTLAADEAFFGAFDSHRATVLRRRITWYFIAAIAVLALAVGINVGAVLDLAPGAAQAELDEAAESRAHAGTTFALLILYAVALAFLILRQPRRAGLVRVLSVVSITAISIAVIMEAVAAWANTTSWLGENAAATRETTAYQAVNALGLLYLLACILVPMRLRESLPIIGVSTLVCIAVVAFVRPASDVLLPLAALLAGYALLPTIYSAWRYRMFDFHFRAERLREKYNSLSGEAREISAELSHARRLHEALFPDAAALAAPPTPVAYRYEPMREIGGDFLYVHHEPPSSTQSGALTLVLIDVSGHGIAAALAVNRLHGELQRFFSHYPAVSGESGRPGHVLMNLNTYACAALAPQGVYATAFIARIDASQLEWASAGHPPALVRSTNPASTPNTRELHSTAVMLGVVDAELFDPAPQTIPFTTGDTLLAYTDGAMEARDAANTDFGLRRIHAVSESAHAPTPGTLARSLMDAVRKHRAGRPSDDTLIVEAHAAAHHAANERPAPARAAAGSNPAHA